MKIFNSGLFIPNCYGRWVIKGFGCILWVTIWKQALPAIDLIMWRGKYI